MLPLLTKTILFSALPPLPPPKSFISLSFLSLSLKQNQVHIKHSFSLKTAMANNNNNNKTSSRQRKPKKRRSHTRKLVQDSFLNIAEARREIVNALHHHRASSSSSSSSKKVFKKMDIIPQHYTFLMEPLPIPSPQPTWSTTAPSIYPSTRPMEVLEFELEWGDTDNSLASSYTWWLSFLNSLDQKPHEEEVASTEADSSHPFGEDIELGSFRYFTKNGASSKGGGGGGEPICLDKEDQSSVLDEWLTVPSTESCSDQMDDHDKVIGGF